MASQTILHDCEPEELARLIADAVADELRKVLEQKQRPRLVDRVEMAELATVSVTTLDGLVSAGKVPSVLIGRRRLFEPGKVIAALSN